jgi:hypothetical protein
VRRHYNLLLFAMAVAGCGSIDKFLEGTQPAEARLTMALQPSAVTIVQGEEETVLATVTRVGDYAGPVVIIVEAVPFGVTAEVGSASTTGAVTTVPVTLRVTTSAAPGSHALRVRGHADPVPVDGTAQLALMVLEPPGYSLALSQTAFTIARGGIAPATVLFSRTNFDAPVTLSLSGAPGITATFGTNPASGGSAAMTLSVDPGVAPGTYDMTLRGTGPDLAERSVSFSVTVTTDPIQLLMTPGLSVRQGSVVTADIIVNRGGYVGPVALSAENLPAGVTASFDPASPTSTSSVITLVLQLTVSPSTYLVRVRGKGDGVPDATADFNLTVNVSGLALSLTPAAVSLFPGTSVTSTLTLLRTALDDAVALSVEGAPPGLTVTPVPASVAANVSTLTVTASGAATPGVYLITIRAIPAGWPPGVSQTVTLDVTVRSLPTGGGNVLLDWSRCAAPDWVAVQDGTGPWTRVIPDAGVVGFSVTSGKGGFAFVEAGNTVVVTYLTQAELTARTFDLCPPLPQQGPKTITGLGVHNSLLEQFTYSLGGATALSTGASPTFSLVGVREGVHDLIAWGTTTGVFGLRGYLLRDLDLPNGASLGSVDLTGVGSFAPARPLLTVIFNVGDLVSHSMSYLTTASCTANPLYIGAFGTSAVMSGVPGPLQRADDFHLLTVTAAATGRTRVLTQAFRTMSARTVTLPPLVGIPAISTLPAGYTILQATIGTIPTAYNGVVTFRYVAGTRSMSVNASIGYAGTSFAVLSMPDFSAVPGWPNASAIGPGEHGIWNLSLDGSSSSGSLCAENRTTVFFNQQGPF